MFKRGEKTGKENKNSRKKSEAAEAAGTARRSYQTSCCKRLSGNLPCFIATLLLGFSEPFPRKYFVDC